MDICHTLDPCTKYSKEIKHVVIELMKMVQNLGMILRLLMMYQDLRDIVPHLSGMDSLSIE